MVVLALTLFLISPSATDENFFIETEVWVAKLPTNHSVYDGLNRETGAIVQNLGSKWWRVRERVMREMVALKRRESL